MIEKLFSLLDLLLAFLKLREIFQEQCDVVMDYSVTDYEIDIKMVSLFIEKYGRCDRYCGFRKKTIAVSENEDKENQCPFTVVASNLKVLSRDDQYVLNQVYHTKTFEDGNHFHRRIMYVCAIRGDTVNNVALVQYCFEEEERDFDLSHMVTTAKMEHKASLAHSPQLWPP